MRSKIRFFLFASLLLGGLSGGLQTASAADGGLWDVTVTIFWMDIKDNSDYAESGNEEYKMASFRTGGSSYQYSDQWSKDGTGTWMGSEPESVWPYNTLAEELNVDYSGFFMRLYDYPGQTDLKIYIFESDSVTSGAGLTTDKIFVYELELFADGTHYPTVTGEDTDNRVILKITTTER